MPGVIGLVLIVLGLVLFYDVVAGKASTIVGVLNGQADTLGKQTATGGPGTLQ